MTLECKSTIAALIHFKLAMVVCSDSNESYANQNDDYVPAPLII